MVGRVTEAVVGGLGDLGGGEERSGVAEVRRVRAWGRVVGRSRCLYRVRAHFAATSRAPPSKGKPVGRRVVKRV
jgi:hypothetical protein